MYLTSVEYLLIIVLLNFFVLSWCQISEASLEEGSEGCSFERDGCTYNIFLSQADVKEESTKSVHLNQKQLCGKANRRVLLEDQVQNDYSAKLDNMEKNFSFLRDAHEQRLKELEGTIQRLVSTSIGSSEEKDSVEITRSGSLLRRGRTQYGDANFMRRLESEFNKLQRDLRQKTSELLDTRAKLNDTSVRMHEEQVQMFKTSKKLLNAENQITALKRERSILKNQLKDRSYRLDISNKKALECERKTAQQQDEILELFRSESILKEDLIIAQLNFNKSQGELTLLKEKHSALKVKQERTRRVMRIRETELMQCHIAKTSTFCGFEDPKMCGFQNINDTRDFFNWERAKGRTPSSRTGPSKDHTCNTETGHFMFIEASAKGRGSNAVLFSPLYRGLTEQCVEFYYHMYGRHIGTLNVYAQALGQGLNSAWRAYGNQGDYWTNARLAVPKELARAGYQIAFEGITENGYQGDISIDDVSVTDGPCPIDEKVVPVRVSVNSTSVVRKGNTFARKIRKKQKRRRGRQ
ncbi:MAM domain-containing glycosylphosphatidylinositol anchor protein 1 [Plakobranchus ocellatus]|uniref:MAM domain-containing glycosylphosphatidylinositol anchor protein 1 n=1 Tax=Plakobranchus ocellatus TaxID=259542 RepID=A0AAV3Z5H0_9GAST|nr:MAM domain-containing glycosylphosphatidylinositol anchor protein 1 [Plakobranchus ocellatus]